MRTKQKRNRQGTSSLAIEAVSTVDESVRFTSFGLGRFSGADDPRRMCGQFAQGIVSSVETGESRKLIERLEIIFRICKMKRHLVLPAGNQSLIHSPPAYKKLPRSHFTWSAQSLI
jgi:hypothetical protein